MAPLRRAAIAVALSLAVAPSAAASTAPIVRLAGGLPGQFVPPSPATSPQPPLGVKFSNADGVAWDHSAASNNVYFTDNHYGDNRVFYLTDAGLSLFAGNGSQIATDNVPASAGIPEPTGVAPYDQGIYITSASQLASSGSLRQYIWDCLCDPNPTHTPIGFGGGLVQPRDLSVDFDQEYGFMADASTGQIRAIDNTVVAGNPTADPQDPSDPGAYDIGAPSDVAVLGQFEFLFTNGSGVWRVTDAGFPDSDALIHLLDSNYVDAPSSIAALADGGYLVYDSGNHVIRRASNLTPDPGPTGVITTIAGNGTQGIADSGTPADQAPLATDGDIAVTPNGLVMTQGDYAVVQMIPAVQITSGPDALTTARTATFGLASWDDNATYECALDDLAPAPCDDGVATPVLDDGDHVMRIQATTTGPLGTIGFKSAKAIRTWTVDSTAPSPIGLLSPGNGEVTDSNTLRWSPATDAGPGDVTYDVFLDGTKRAEPVSCAADACTVAMTLPDGAHSWQVKARDEAGNVRESPVGSFTSRQPPVARLTVSPNPALAGRTVTFDASKSSDPNGQITSVVWDLDGNGSFETETGTSLTTTRSYPTPATVQAQVQVTDSGGNTSVAGARLTVTAVPPRNKPLGVSINDGAQYTNDPKVTIFGVWPSFASDAFVSNDGGFKNGRLFPVAEQIAWTLDSSGPERLPKTIYVRFQSGSQTSETYQDDIILDQTPPKVLSASLSSGGSAARAAAARKVTLKLRAKDNVSGVGGVQVTRNKRKPGRVLRYKPKLEVASAPTLFVRVRDRAGNFSGWRKAKR
jgi:hypothetical protein